MTRVIGSKRAALLLGIHRSTLNKLAREGNAPGLLYKQPGGYANLGQYMFDADVIERIARDRIAELKAVLDRELPPQLPLEESPSPADEEMRAAS